MLIRKITVFPLDWNNSDDFSRWSFVFQFDRLLSISGFTV